MLCAGVYLLCRFLNRINKKCTVNFNTIKNNIEKDNDLPNNIIKTSRIIIRGDQFICSKNIYEDINIEKGDIVVYAGWGEGKLHLNIALGDTVSSSGEVITPSPTMFPLPDFNIGDIKIDGNGLTVGKVLERVKKGVFNGTITIND